MATNNDGFPPNDGFPLFISEYAGEGEQPGTGQVWDGSVISSRTLKTSILLATAAPIVFAILWVANPTVLFANATTSLASTFAPPDETGAQALSPTARQAPSREEVAAALRAAFQSQTEARRQPAEVLLKQFQTWAAAENTNDAVAADQSQTETRQPSAGVLVDAIPDLGRGGRFPRTGRAVTARRCGSAACANYPSTGPAHAKAPTGPSRAKRAGRDPARARCRGNVAPASIWLARLDSNYGDSASDRRRRLTVNRCDLPRRYRHCGHADHHAAETDPCRRGQGFTEKNHAKRDTDRHPQVGLGCCTDRA